MPPAMVPSPPNPLAFALKSPARHAPVSPPSKPSFPGQEGSGLKVENNHQGGQLQFQEGAAYDPLDVSPQVSKLSKAPLQDQGQLTTATPHARKSVLMAPLTGPEIAALNKEYLEPLMDHADVLFSV